MGEALTKTERRDLNEGRIALARFTTSRLVEQHERYYREWRDAVKARHLAALTKGGSND